MNGDWDLDLPGLHRRTKRRAWWIIIALVVVAVAVTVAVS